MILLIFTCLFSLKITAGEIPYFLRSPRAMLMGDAFVAAPDDEFSIYYNPATLGNGKILEFSSINPTFGFSNILSEMDKFDNFPNDPSEIARRIMNTPLFLQTMGGPVLKFGSFGLGLFANMSSNFILRNVIYPQLEVDYRFDKGFITSYAHSWGRGGKQSKYNPYEKVKISSAGYRLSIGASVKYIDRSVLLGNYSLFGVRLLNAISTGSNDLSQIRSNLGYARGSAWGIDSGLSFLYSNGKSELTFGLSLLDIAGTNFTRKSGEVSISEQPMIITSGFSFSQKRAGFGYRLSADLHPINSSLDFFRTLHLGGIVSLPIVDLFVGYGSGYLSYGAQVDLWLLKLTAGFYGVEIGTSYREQEAPRAVIQISLFDLAYDI